MADNPKTVYVYVYLDPRKRGVFKYGDWMFECEPFYVGKGSKKRSRSHLYQARGHYNVNLHKERKIRRIWEEGLEPVIELIALSEHETALKMETQLVDLIGRSPKGPLTNIWPGGEAGPRGMKHSAATLAKMSKTRKGRKFTEQHKAGMRNAWTTKKRQEAAELVSKNWIVIDPNGNEKLTRNLHAFCKVQRLNSSYMSAIASGKTKKSGTGNLYIPRTCKGWSCRKA